MARYTGPKNRLARKIGEDLGFKMNALKVAKRLMVRPGQHGIKPRRRVSDYGIQLKEKQKIKYLYGILEKQLRRLYAVASKNPTVTGAALLGLLERRLDNIVYRLSWVPTRAAARQLVSHGHIKVNDHKVTVPSYRVNVGDIITLGSKAAKIPVVKELLQDKSSKNPDWLERKGVIGAVKRLPERSDVTENINEQLIVEFYSR